MTGRLPAPLPWLAGLLAIYLIAPFFAGLAATRLANWQSVDVAQLAHACLVSIGSATCAALLIAMGGIPLGYLLARRPGRIVSALGFVVQLPLALPPLTSGILLLFLIGYSTPIGQATGGILTDSFLGIVLAEVFVAAPFLVIAARSAFAASDPVLEGVAATLGRGGLAVFFRVSLPIAMPGIAAGLLLAWLRAFGEFGATVMVAYHPYSLPVYTFVAFGSQGLPAMLPVILPTVVVALAVMGFSATALHPRSDPGGAPAGAEPLASAPIGSAVVTGPPRLEGDLRVRLKKRLGSFDLDIAWAPQARRLAILGPSGSGKSLSLRMIAGIEPGDLGMVMLDGKDLSRCDPALRRIGYVPQNYGLFPHLTVTENLLFPRNADSALVGHWIELLGLKGLEHRRPAALSLGQQQRVALARALVRPAGLLLLDEPFSALDAPLRARLREELRGLQHQLTATTILVTHDPSEAAMLADEILVVGDGRALQSGPTASLFLRPVSELVARLLGAQAIAHGVAASPNAIAIGDDIIVTVRGPALTRGQAVGWSFPPAQARVNDAGPYSGVVERVGSAAIGWELKIRVGKTAVSLLHAGDAPRPGDDVRFEIDPGVVQVWPQERGA